MFSGGGDYWYLWKTGFLNDDGSMAFIHDDDVHKMPDLPHTHDPLGGGGIAYNSWHAALVAGVYTNIGQQPFFHFTYLRDDHDNPIEAPDGIPQNAASVRAQTGALATDPLPKPYVAVWRFIYSPDLIQARMAGNYA